MRLYELVFESGGKILRMYKWYDSNHEARHECYRMEDLASANDRQLTFLCYSFCETGGGMFQ